MISIHDPITFTEAPFTTDPIAELIYTGCPGLGRWCGAEPAAGDHYCPECRAKARALEVQVESLATGRRLRTLLLAREAMSERRTTCAACGDISDATICRACAETEEYCSCGANATAFVAVGAHRQPVCDVCEGRLI